MAYKNKTIRNPVKATYSAMPTEPASHYHPYQDEFFTIISGEMTIRLDGEEKHALQAGDSRRYSYRRSFFLC